MNIFNNYALYYNLLYRDKDYAGEADYIDRLIREHKPGARTVLDMGCGTGRHARLLAQKGYQVHGVDMSEGMLASAKEKADGEHLVFSHGDIRSVRLGKKFDAVVSLFHVISYQTGNADLCKAFTTAYEHLNPAGIFIFDCWYGPAVLTDRPVVRIKRLEDENLEVTRLAEPVMHAGENIVDVNYQVFIKNKITGNVEELKETHRMRYLFKPEINMILTQAGFTLENCFEFMTGNKPGYDTWNVCFIGRKR